MTTDTRAALDAAIDDYGNATAREAENRDERTALDRAIAAHVAAEVARALEAAPEVEAAIGSVTCRRCDHDDPLGDSVSDALRAAIAADKARAVAAAHEGMRRVYADRMLARDREAMEALAALDEARAARPTPDEARRLLDEYDRATRHSYVTGGPEHLRAARAALLRALGVEA